MLEPSAHRACSRVASIDLRGLRCAGFIDRCNGIGPLQQLGRLNLERFVTLNPKVKLTLRVG
jgi:hypothetical protein